MGETGGCLRHENTIIKLEGDMIAVNGLYVGGDTVKIEKLDVPVNPSCKVIVTFVEPAVDAVRGTKQTEEADMEKRRTVFERLMQTIANSEETLPADLKGEKNEDRFI
jgi:hypothetical protein